MLRTYHHLHFARNFETDPMGQVPGLKTPIFFFIFLFGFQFFQWGAA